MYYCRLCTYRSPINRFALKLLLQHIKAAHPGFGVVAAEYESPVRLGEDSFNNVIQYRIDNVEHTSSRRLMVAEGLPENAPSVGGKHKKFAPEHGLVWAPTTHGLSDFPKETSIKGTLGGLTFDDGTSVRDIFFSFQNELDPSIYQDTGEELHQQTSRYRRVSLYDASQIGELPARSTRNPSLNGYINTLKENKNHIQLGVLRTAVTRMIHQIVFIHYYLYKAYVQHGDLHLGNIKVIIDQEDFPAIKAFDFGKAKLVRSGADRVKDLEYLCSRKAVSGSMETWKRNTWRSDDSSDQLKHYPLHRLSMLMFDGIYPKEEVYSRIQTLGEPLIETLKSAGEGSLPRGKTRMLFQSFSDELVDMFYQRG